MTRVLIVDDIEANLAYLRALLQGHGFQVDSALHGAAALVLARQMVPDVVISDLLMPVMDGYTLLRQWRADEQLQHVPFVVYTATYTDPADERLAMELGADAFLLKPAEPDEFLACLRKVLADLPQKPSRASQSRDGPPPTLLEQYNATLVRKLEAKTLQLEEANRVLKLDIAEREQLVATQMSILDALPAHIALVDGEGRILAVNDSWRRFANANAMQSASFGVGDNYLNVCDRAQGECAEEAVVVAAGIRQVLSGAIAQFVLEYPCHAPDSTLR